MRSDRVVALYHRTSSKLDEDLYTSSSRLEQVAPDGPTYALNSWSSINSSNGPALPASVGAVGNGLARTGAAGVGRTTEHGRVLSPPAGQLLADHGPAQIRIVQFDQTDGERRHLAEGRSKFRIFPCSDDLGIGHIRLLSSCISCAS